VDTGGSEVFGGAVVLGCEEIDPVPVKVSPAGNSRDPLPGKPGVTGNDGLLGSPERPEDGLGATPPSDIPAVLATAGA
jgi:hypothetical protein